MDDIGLNLADGLKETIPSERIRGRLFVDMVDGNPGRSEFWLQRTAASKHDDRWIEFVAVDTAGEHRELFLSTTLIERGDDQANFDRS